MVSMYLWQKIKQAHSNGQSLRSIAREHKISRTTVRKYVRDVNPPEFHARDYKRKTGPYMDNIKKMFEDLYIGTRIFKEIQKLGYDGSQSTLDRCLQELKEGRRIRNGATTRFETAPGKQMQYDWKEWMLIVGDVQVKVYIHCIILCYSRKKFYTISLRITANDIIQALVQAIDYFGGYAKSLIVDNPKQLIIRHGKNGDIILNDLFLKFCGLYGIEPDPCIPYRPRTKGKVERPFFYLQEHFLRGNDFETITILNQALKDFTGQENQRFIKQFEQSANERFLIEKEALKKIPRFDPMHLTNRQLRKVSLDGYVSWDGKLYPVAMHYAGKWILIETQLGKQLKTFSKQGHLISEFEKRLSGAYRIQHPEHIIINNAYLQKKQTVRDGCLKQFIDQFGETGQAFAEQLYLIAKTGFYSHLKEILGLCELYEVKVVQMVLQQCLQSELIHKNYVVELMAKKPLKWPQSSPSSETSCRPYVDITRSLSHYANLANEPEVRYV